MLMSQFAMMDLGPSRTSVLARLQQAIARFFGFGEVPPELRDVLRPDPQPGQDVHRREHDQIAPAQQL